MEKSVALVEPDWLERHLDDPGLVVLDTSVKNPIGMQVSDKLMGMQIPKSRYFDLDGEFSDPDSSLPHMMPEANYFNHAAKSLGINNSDLVVLYDNVGVYSSPRIWWMFKAMGHENVVVLNGGIKAWVASGQSIEKKIDRPVGKGDFTGELQPVFFQSSGQVFNQHKLSGYQILDARSEGRFFAKEPEPRSGLRGGHIPHSKCLPFTKLLDGFRMKDSHALQKIFKDLVQEDDHLIFSCGSGLTACILALGAYQAGYLNMSVYDGSWSEWGGNLELPVSI